MKTIRMILLLMIIGLAACTAQPIQPAARQGSEADEVPSAEALPQEEDEKGEEEKMDTLTLTEADSGRTVSVNGGATFSVRLTGNLTTGYGWAVEEMDRQYLSLEGDPGYERNSELIGAGEETIFTFKALAPGETQLRLIYRRPFEAEKPPEKTFEATIFVQ